MREAVLPTQPFSLLADVDVESSRRYGGCRRQVARLHSSEMGSHLFKYRHAFCEASSCVSPQPAGYSGTPLVRKLGIKPSAAVALIGAPDGFDETLGELPDGVTVRRSLRGQPDVIVAFFVERPRFGRRLPDLRDALAPDGGLWIAWPKRASGVATDMSENVVRDAGLRAGLVDNKVCAIDEVWSGLRLVYRVKDRPGLMRRSAPDG